MQLTEQQIEKYQELYLNNFGVEISKSDALTQGLALLRLVKNITTPLVEINEKEDYNEQPTNAPTITP